MELRLLEIEEQNEHLSACPLSLLLGVFTENNQIEGFLNFARRILHTEHAIFSFHDEPYIWYSNHCSFRACYDPPEANFPRFYQGERIMSPQHPHYAEFIDHLAYLGLKQQRLIGVNLKDHDGRSVGQAIFFDHHMDEFKEESIETVADFADGMMRYILLQVDHAHLKEQYEQQVALNSSKTKFFQIIAHDLRAPFHGLLGFSEVLAHEYDSLDPQSVQNIAEYLFDTSQSTYNLLESLLNWAISEGGRIVYHPINFKVQQSSKIVCDVLEGLAKKKNIQLINQVPDELKIHADINMITSVIQNLVSNALKFTHTNGSGCVTIDAKAHDEWINIYIKDNGLGMTQQQVEHLFEPKLMVSHKGTNGEKGTGLGLVLCKRFIELNFGKIQVDSEQGKGTVFTVSLPIATNQHQALDPQQNLKNQDIH